MVQTTYDIIKGHSGKLKVESKENKGTIHFSINCKIINENCSRQTKK
jgi:hypothetical protein